MDLLVIGSLLFFATYLFNSPIERKTLDENRLKEISMIISEKIKNRQDSFVGKYTFKKYAQIMPVQITVCLFQNLEFSR